MRASRLFSAVALTAATTGAAVAAFPGSSSAFNPQPDPPGRVIIDVSGQNRCTIKLYLPSASLALVLIQVTLPAAGFLPPDPCMPPAR